eukprot:TRINITY_DN1815_c0_g1_i1.p1 TRINITY_DN1815_c0_g1~~TRINITY_DN1815_c0_g1_i1.p1  ORF type:complete len:220 (+),score=29.09 TRINITY_DN1815_c0_g1_i1:56-715(+)
MENNSATYPVNLSPLKGRWVGIYGPHGLEHLEVTVENNILEATKITGDPNIPAGKVSFKCNGDNGVASGQIANHGYVSPSWVPGKLEWNTNELDEFEFYWQGCGSVRFFRVPNSFVMNDDSIRTFFAQNYSRFVQIGGLLYILANSVKKPADEQKVNSLEVVKCQKKEELTIQRCTICLVDFEEGDDVNKLPCNHFFHPECIKKWLLMQDACPLCKKSI